MLPKLVTISVVAVLQGLLSPRLRCLAQKQAAIQAPGSLGLPVVVYSEPKATIVSQL